MTRVIAFGVFDPLHEGHKNFLRQARALGDHLTVVVAHDSAVRAYKRREPRLSEAERLAVVKGLVGVVDVAILGRETADRYHILGEIDFDIVALGYNQKPTDEEVRAHLDEKGKYQVKVVRLKPFEPEKYP